MNTKIFLSLLFLITLSALGRSVVPDRVVTLPLDLYNSRNTELPNGEILVSVTTYNRRGFFQKNGSTAVLSRSQYESFKKLSEAVYEMVPNQNSSRTTLIEKGRRGTAFSIGNNLVLTNHHVLDPNFSARNCRDFELVSSNGNKFRCQKVHYCNPEHDICLIEMASSTRTQRDCLFCPRTRYEVSLSEGAKLKLSSSYSPLKPSEEITTAIGNTSGFGIHISQGRGVIFRSNRLDFFAPITTGNSGGPLLDQQGNVIGVVRAQSTTLIDDRTDHAFNVATPSDMIIRLIREALVIDPETLEKFNSSVVQ